MSGELPEGWASARIADVFEVNPRKPAADHVRDSTPVSFVPMGAVDADRGAITESEERAFGAVRKGYTAFADGDVLLAKITPCFENGKAAVASSLRNGLGFGSSEFHVFRPQGAVLAPYLFHFLRQPQLRADAAESMTGTAGQARVPIDYLRKLELPIAPLAEQRRIVAKVEALLEQVRRAKDRLDRVPVILKRFRQAVLAAACEGRLTEEWRSERVGIEPASDLLRKIAAKRIELGLPSAKRVLDAEGIDLPETELPESWCWCRVGQLADVRLGGTPSRKDASCWNGDVPWVSSGEVANCRITTTTERITQRGFENSNAKLYPPGTVLIAMIGEGKTRGQSAILDILAATNQNVAGLVFDVEGVDAEYVWLWALSEYEKNREAGRGGNQPALNGAKVRALPVPLPPLEEQQQIVRRARQLLALLEATERRILRVSQRSDALPQAILSKAFAGELVPTEADLARAEGRDYETAEQLLERVRREQDESAIKEAGPQRKQQRRVRT